MKLKFNNYARELERRQGRSYFRWRIFMDEPREVLDRVDSVQYTLHPTFPNRIRVVNNQESNFSLTATGWGEFNILITVFMKDGTEYHTQYPLDLRKEWREDTL